MPTDRTPCADERTDSSIAAEDRTTEHSESTRDDSPRGLPTRRQFFGAVGATGIGLTAGCTSSITGGSSDETITVGYQQFGTPYWSELLVKNGELAEQYLPDGYSVEWQTALQGSVIGNRMVSGENEIGYNGDMPTIMAIINEDTPISMTGLSAWSWGQQCNLVITPTDRDFDGPQDLDGMNVGITTGSCTHRFWLDVEEREGISAEITDTDINTILAEIREGNLDAGLMWEPNPSMAVTQQEEANWFFTGARYNDPDMGSVSMTDEFIEENEDAAIAYMKAELEAKHIFEDDQERAVELIGEEPDLEDYDAETIEASIYEPIDANGEEVNKMEFATDMRQIEPIDVHIKETAANFLVDQGEIERAPEEDDFNWDVLDAAIEELQDEGVDWDPTDEEVTTG
ncbi:ABC transporter substrate-binding protein [Saliphagus infecundisoli]|uniref:ABC transporter substrate-binding protein n=1 Tax=Saliphagus infecundisoli TaxID=1849069 RepID=A0ABD5QAV6_9EURY|nr:transporter substrate-binding domain-containing protein [Saliphagus infecundisoli]